MSTPYIGDFQLGEVVEHWFGSHSVAGASITIGTNGTFRVYRGGLLIAPVVSFSEDVSGYTGSHKVLIDLSHADFLPFYNYAVVYQGAVVDGQTQNVPLFTFSIMNRGTEVMARTTLTAVTSDGGTLNSYARVNTGDYVQLVTDVVTRPDFGIIDSFNAGTGEFVLRAPWRTLPVVGDYVQVIAAPAGGIIGAADIADNAFTSAKFADGFLTNAKLGAGAISEAKIDTDVGTFLYTQSQAATDQAALVANQVAISTGVQDANAALDAAVLDRQTKFTADEADHDTTQSLLAGVQASLGTMAASTRDSVFAKIVDASGLTMEEAIRIVVAVLAGKSNGLAAIGGTAHFRDVADSKDVVTAVLDASGNRASVTLDP